MEHFNSLSKFVVILEYDGSQYHGFQWQLGKPTVQACLEEAIHRVTGENRRILAASRTDTGVHAKMQVVSFRSNTSLPPQTMVKALNFYLPQDIAVKAAEKVEADFNVRRNALSREYEYRILNSQVRSPLLAGRVYQVPYKLDIDLLNKACQLLEGEHDFSSFAAAATRTKSTVRHVSRAYFGQDGGLTIFFIKADSFLMHQVRNTVGLLLRIGSGKVDISELKHVMEQRKYGLAGPSAPACGLYLTRINYPRELELKYENLFNQSW